MPSRPPRKTNLPPKNRGSITTSRYSQDLKAVRDKAREGDAVAAVSPQEQAPTSVAIPPHAHLLLRAAGRCTHERCSAMREKGMQLAKAAGYHIPNSDPLPPIPSKAITHKYYDTVEGKQDRTNVKTYTELRPKYPKSAEWLEAAQSSGNLNPLYSAEDLLEHHHDD